MLVVVTLLFTDSATAWATLGRTPRIDLDNNTVIFNSFVGQELFLVHRVCFGEVLPFPLLTSSCTLRRRKFPTSHRYIEEHPTILSWVSEKAMAEGTEGASSWRILPQIAGFLHPRGIEMDWAFIEEADMEADARGSFPFFHGTWRAEGGIGKDGVFLPMLLS